MRLNTPVSRRRVLSLTPLIDVVFLLLVFFMLASTFVRFSTVKIETAGAGSSGQPDRTTLALIHVGKEAAVHVNGQLVSREQLPEKLASLITEGKTNAVVIVRKDTQVSDLIIGLAQVRAANFSSVRVVD